MTRLAPKRPYLHFRLSVVIAVSRVPLSSPWLKNRFVVGISILSAIVPEIKLFPVLSATMPFPVISRYCSHPNTLF